MMSRRWDFIFTCVFPVLLCKTPFVIALGREGNSLHSKEDAYIFHTIEYWGKPVVIFSLSLQ